MKRYAVFLIAILALAQTSDDGTYIRFPANRIVKVGTTTIDPSTGIVTPGCTGCGGGGGTWGSITGTLSNQTDLQNALNLKAPLASPTFTGPLTISGSTSGTTLLQATAIASGTLTFPARTANVATTTGAFTTGHCWQTDASGNAVDSGSACGGGSGGATILLAGAATSGGAYQVDAGTNYFYALYGVIFAQAAAGNNTFSIHRSGTAQKLCTTTASSQPGDGSLVFTLYKNGSSTPVTFTLAASAGAQEKCSTVTDTVADGDTLTVRIQNNASTGSAGIIYLYMEIL